MLSLIGNHPGPCPAWPMLGDEMARCVGRMWERLCILLPAPPASAIKYLQTLYGAKKNSPPQPYSTIYRIYALNYSANYSTIFLVLSPGDIFKNSQHKRIDSQPTKIVNRIANLGNRRMDNMGIPLRPENRFI